MGNGGLLASGGNDHSVRLWSARDHGAVLVMRGHESRVWHLAASASGRQLASASADGTVRVWGLGERGEAPPPPDGAPPGEVRRRGPPSGTAAAASRPTPRAPGALTSSRRAPRAA